MSDNKENLYQICPLALLHHHSSSMKVPPRSSSNVEVATTLYGQVEQGTQSSSIKVDTTCCTHKRVGTK